MNNNSQSDLAKHVARVIRAMNRRKSALGESTTSESNGFSQASDMESFSAGEINSSDAETAHYPSWTEHL